MEKYNIDDNLTKLLLDIPLVDNILKDIHPNVITIIGLISVLLLNHIYFNNDLSIYKTNQNIAILLFVKYITDVLDGGMARKYNKMSKLGNFLDTLADNTFTYFMLYYLLNKFNLPNYYSIYIFLVIIVFTNHFDLLSSHNSLKSKNLFNILIANSYLIYIFIYFYIKNKN
jgi:hypothetical protein